MSTSENSFSFCFWRFDMIENAMSSVSSGDNRGASAIGYNSPPMRITGNEPTFKCRSEAKWAVAVTRRSSILTGMVDAEVLRFLKGGPGVAPVEFHAQAARATKSLERVKGKKPGGQRRFPQKDGTEIILAIRVKTSQRFLQSTLRVQASPVPCKTT